MLASTVRPRIGFDPPLPAPRRYAAGARRAVRSVVLPAVLVGGLLLTGADRGGLPLHRTPAPAERAGLADAGLPGSPGFGQAQSTRTAGTE